MNIVKINSTCTNLDFRNKYCYVLHDHNGDKGYMYLVPVDKITQDQYLAVVRGEELPSGVDTIMYRDSYVDRSKSPMYFSPYDYVKYNTTDPKDLEAAKYFRTNFAKCIYTNEMIMKQLFRTATDRISFLGLSDGETVVFNYYAHNMQDETLSVLKMMDGDTNKDKQVSSIYADLDLTKTNTACSCSSKAVSEYSIIHSYCILSDEYKVRMKDLMTVVFTNLDFWKKLKGTGIAVNMASLVEKVINAGYSIFDGSKQIDLASSCEDACHNEGLYNTFKNDLEDMIQVLNYVEDGNFQYSSFMSGVLTKFAAYYEYMQWDDSIVVSTSRI